MSETNRVPRNSSELRSALSMRRVRGEKRRVAVYHFPTRKDPGFYDIHVAEGNDLTIEVYGGLPQLRVVGSGGNLTVVFKSSWGNSLTIEPGQKVRVEVPYFDTKVTISGDDTNLDLQLPGDKHRVYWPSKYPPLNPVGNV